MTLESNQFDDHNKRITEGVNNFLRFPDTREFFTRGLACSWEPQHSSVNQEVTAPTFNVQNIFQVAPE